MIHFIAPVALMLASLTPIDESGFQSLVAAHQGKVVLYDFWATWCGGCREEMPELLKLQSKLKARGFELVLVSADEPEQEAEAAKFLATNGSSGKTYRKQAKNDDRFIRAIDPKWTGALPALFLYDRKGHKVQSFIGQTSVQTLEAAIGKIL